MSMNSWAFTGRLGRDSELRILPGGTSVLNFSAAVDVGFGEKKATIWPNCSMFGDRAEKLEQYLKKGQQVGIVGEVSLREWGNDGQTKTALEVRVLSVELLGSKDGGRQDRSEPARQQRTPPQTKPAQKFSDFDDDVPFATCDHAADTICRKHARRLGRYA